jgi:PAS domain S-box-containing protein
MSESFLPKHSDAGFSDDEARRMHKTILLHHEVLQIQRAMVYSVDLGTDSFQYISPNAEELTGFTADEWLESKFSAMLARCHPDDIPAILSDIDKFGRLSNPQGVSEYRWKDNFGRWRWCNDHFRVLLDRHGQAKGMIGCLRDVTDQKAVQDPRNAWFKSSPPPQQTKPCPADGEDALAALVDTGGLGLTRIQRKVLGMILVGLTNKQIAFRIHRSIRTVEDHRYRIMKKLGAENSVDLVRKVLWINSSRAA